MSVSMPVCLSVSSCLPVSCPCNCVCLFACLSVSLDLHICLFFSVTVLFACLFVSLYLHVCLFVSVTVYVCLSVKLQTLVYDILPSTTAVFSYAIGSRKLSANEQFFVGAHTVVSLLQTTQIKRGVSSIAANKVYISTNKTTIV